MKKSAFNDMKFYINNCKIAGSLRKGAIPYFEADMDGVAPEYLSVNVGMNHGDKNLRKKVITRVRITREGADSYDDVINYFDMMVADAIYSLWRADIVAITPLDVYRVMAGDPERILSPARRQEIIESIDKLAAVDIDIRCEAEMLERDNDKVESIERSFLPCRKIESKTGDRTMVKYYLAEKMPLYEYAEYTKQMIALPLDIFNLNLEPQGAKTTNARKGKNDTEDVVMLKHILLRRIEIMRNEKNGRHERRISLIRRESTGEGKYTGILPLMGISRDYKVPGEKAENGAIGKGHKKVYYTASAWTHKKEQIAGHIKNILEHYKKIGYIENFEPEANSIEWKKELKNVQILGVIGNPDEVVRRYKENGLGTDV